MTHRVSRLDPLEAWCAVALATVVALATTALATSVALHAALPPPS